METFHSILYMMMLCVSLGNTCADLFYVLCALPTLLPSKAIIIDKCSTLVQVLVCHMVVRVWFGVKWPLLELTSAHRKVPACR